MLVRNGLGDRSIIGCKARCLIDALASGLQGSDAVATALREVEADRERIVLRLETMSEPIPVNLLATVSDAASKFGRMVHELPANLSDPESVYEARETLRDWLGEIRITPTEDGPTAYWRLNEEGLLLTAGPRVAEMVAGAGTVQSVTGKSMWLHGSVNV